MGYTDLERKVRSDRALRRKREVNAYVVSTKTNKPCLDCGTVYPPVVMDYDHRPGETKKFGLSRAGKLGQSIAAINAEITKCDLVCSNCHRLRTESRYVTEREGE